MELHFTDLSGRKPISRISVTKYEIDEETKMITKYPRGIISIYAGVKKGQTLAHFPKEACAMYELKKSMLLQRTEKRLRGEDKSKIDRSSQTTGKDRM